MDILLLIAFGFALKMAWEETRKSAAKSRSAKLRDIAKKHPKISKTRRSAMLRRHQAGYWASEALRGFPEGRHGFMTGWHAHKSARDEAYAARVKAEADHHETRASILEQVAVHRRRAAMALDEQRRLTTPEPAPELEAAAEGSDAEVAPLPLRSVPDLPEDPPAALPDDGWPSGIPHHRHGSAGASPLPAAPASPSPATEGAPVPGEVTYDEVLRQARQYADTAEAYLAGVRDKKKALTAMADHMQALDVDSASLAEVADLIDLHGDAETALAQAHDHATAFAGAFARRHSLLAEAHQSAPVPAAQRDFYQG